MNTMGVLYPALLTRPDITRRAQRTLDEVNSFPLHYLDISFMNWLHFPFHSYCLHDTPQGWRSNIGEWTPQPSRHQVHGGFHVLVARV